MFIIRMRFLAKLGIPSVLRRTKEGLGELSVFRMTMENSASVTDFVIQSKREARREESHLFL